MAGERKESSVLFTLKELKDITAEETNAPVSRPVAAPAARRRGGLVDDADALLADLRDSVSADAEAETARIEAERRAAEENERRKIMETQAQERAAIDARIAAERARQQAAAEEREARLRAQDIAERRARGEIIDEPAPRQVMMPSAQPAQVIMSPQPPAPQGRGTGFYLTVVGVPVLCLTAVALALILRPVEQPKPQVVTEAPPPSVVTINSPPPAVRLPPAAVAEEDEDEDDGDAGVAPDAAPQPKVAVKTRKPPRGKKSGASTATAKAGEKKEPAKKGLQLGGDKGGGITF